MGSILGTKGCEVTHRERHGEGSQASTVSRDAESSERSASGFSHHALRSEDSASRLTAGRLLVLCSCSLLCLLQSLREFLVGIAIFKRWPTVVVRLSTLE